MDLKYVETKCIIIAINQISPLTFDHPYKKDSYCSYSFIFKKVHKSTQ